jgi:protein SCO1/2
MQAQMVQGETTRGNRRTLRRRSIGTALSALVVALGIACPATALADGDPASDVLVTQNVFVPVDAGLSNAQRARLTGLLDASERARFPIRVAIVPSPLDLGAVTELWREPRTYARFLGIELSLIYKGPLLVVMPNGLGVNWPGRSTASVERLLEGIPVQASGAGLLATVQSAVRKLSASAGTSAGASTGTSAGASKPHGEGDTLQALLIVAAVAVLAISGLSLATRRRRPDGGEADAPAGAGQRAAALWLSWALPGFVLAAAIAAIAHALAPAGPRYVGAAGHTAENRPLIFPPTRKLAPSFRLTDQNGHPVSLAAYRGHPVILTFVDPQDAAPGPLPVQILSGAERALAPAQRPQILAISVDAAADGRASLLHDLSAWHLSPQWRWAVGSQQQLASVWKRYYVVVDDVTKRSSGATEHRVVHSQMAYLIDANGHESALFGWPYSVRELTRTLRRLDGSTPPAGI